MKKILPHISIIISLMCITFFIIDIFNESMAFLDNDITKWLVFILSIVSIVNSVMLIVCFGRDNKR